ncbi:MAG: tripartite tricarboxylate transporter substrate binding protein [Pseudomonadota bacterium]|nr:tripartite tricarboxylate transporter substrate binding protein [Pseudomonadota bacterium]
MKLIRQFAILAAGLALSALAVAQGYPQKPVRIIVAYQAGQGTDVATRYIAERLTHALGQSFYVDNKPGAGGNIGTEAAARSAPDGYTLTMGTNATHGTNQFLYDAVPFDAEKDFEPIILIGSFPMVVAANPSFPGNTIADLVALAKSTPKSADIAMPSTTARIVFELLKSQSGAPLFGIPYKGSSTAISEVMGGQLPLVIDTVTAARPHIAAGKLKAIAVTSLKGTDLLPGVKPVAEQGLPGFQVIAWNALYAPKGTPKAIVQELNAEINKILAQPEARQKLKDLGYDVGGGTTEQLAEFGRSERRKWGPLIAASGIKAE